MRWVSFVFVGVCLAGCPGASPGTPDGNPGGDDGPAPGASTLRIAWALDNIGDIGDLVVPATGYSLDEAKFRMENLHATLITDPDNPATSKDEYKLRWTTDDEPDAIKFDNVPSGHYSSVVLQLDDSGGDKAFELHGHYNDGADSWEIDSINSLSISLDASLDLLPDTDVTITIEIGVAAAVNKVDFAANDDISDIDLIEMSAFRADLQNAFRFAGATPSPN